MEVESHTKAALTLKLVPRVLDP